MAILLNPRRRKRAKSRAKAKNPRRKKTTRKRRKAGVAYVGEVARPKLVYVGTQGGKRVYRRTERSREKYPDVIVKNPRRKRKRNPIDMATITDSIVKGAYGVVGIAGVNAITNIASKFLPLDNVYLKSAVKVVLGVAVPELLKKQLGRDTTKVIQVVVVSYVLFELIRNLLPENVKSIVSALETPKPEKVYYALPSLTTSAVYPENSYASNVQYELN